MFRTEFAFTTRNTHTNAKIAYLVVAEVPALVPVRIVAEVEVVNVRTGDVTRDRDVVENLRVRQIFAEPAYLVGDAVALRVVPSKVCFVCLTQANEDIVLSGG